MPSVTYNGQSFAIDNRRLWVLGASLDYARIPPELWEERIAAAKQAGFNTIRTCCPWLLHEPRRGKYNFTGGADLRRFLELCGQQGMFVILQPGPFCGDGYDGGGIPPWIADESPEGLRISGGPYLDHAGRFLKKLLGLVADLQATKGGPILLIYVEQEWTSGHDAEAERYMGRLTKIMRETGIAIPLINNHDLWVDSASAGGSIHTWRGGGDLLVHLRQLRAVQPEAPRLVSVQSGGESFAYWGQEVSENQWGHSLLRHVAEVLAAGAQPIIHPFHGGTNFGFLGGRRPGEEDNFVTTSATLRPALGEAGARGETYNLLKRIITFASHFSHVFTDLNPEYHPIVLDIEETAGNRRDRSGKNVVPGMSVVPQRGANGRVVFVFSNGAIDRTTLLLDDGLRLPVHLGGQSVAWFVIDADLKGAGRLDYANICPWAIVNRRILVLHGPAKSPALLSINGSPLETTVPGGKTPKIIKHQGLTVVICNQAQIDACYHDEERVYIGAAGLNGAGEPLPAPGFKTLLIVSSDDEVEKRKNDTATAGSSAEGTTGGRKSSRLSMTLSSWTAAPESEFTSGSSPRFASLGGPESLVSCGAGDGYGWYRLTFPSGSPQKQLALLPGAADRLHLFRNSKPAGLYGVGPGTDHGLLELPPDRNESVWVVLADNRGRMDGGNHRGDRKGLFEPWYAVQPFACAPPQTVVAAAVEPFSLRPFISGLALRTMSDTHQVAWTFNHYKKTPLLVNVRNVAVSGTFVLNDEPLRYFAGASGSTHDCLVLHPDQLENFRRGKNILRFAPDPRQSGVLEQLTKGVVIYEGVESPTAEASWSFAKWRPSVMDKGAPITSRNIPSFRGAPAWCQCLFPPPRTTLPVWFDTIGLSKGQVFVNSRNLGRYFTNTAAGKPVGPQRRLYMPTPWLREDQENKLMIFDEHGCDPRKTKLVFAPTGDLD